MPVAMAARAICSTSKPVFWPASPPIGYPAPAPIRGTAARLNPLVYIGGGRYVVSYFAAAVHARELGACVAMLADQHESITAALDLLITGV